MSLISPLGLPTGARRPRVETHPVYVDSYGPEAAELMARAGQPLDPWQQGSVTLMLACRADGKWACFEYAELCPRQNGKGAILEARAMAGLFLLGERLIMWSAHEYKTAMEAFRRILWLLGNLGTKVNDNLYDVDGVLVKVTNTNGEEGLERLDTGQRVKFIARSKGSGRGFSGDVNIIDEAFAYTPTQQSALMPTMSARPNPQIIYASSPPLDGLSGQVLYLLRLRGDPGAPREDGDAPWQQDDGLGYRDWGLAGDLATLHTINLDDVALQAAANPAMGIRISAETIARERRSMSPVDYARERLGIWPVQVTQDGAGDLPVLDPALWADMLDPDSRRGGDVALAVDVTPLRDHASIAMVGLREDGLWHVQLVDYRPGTGWIVARLVELVDALDPVAVCLDAKGGAAALLDELAEAGISLPDDSEQPARGDLVITGVAEIAAAVAQWIDGYRACEYRHPDQQPLTDAIANAKTRPIGDAGAVAWGRKASTVDIGPLITVTLARWAYLHRIEAINQVFEPSAFWV